MVSTCPLISNSSSHLSQPLGIVPSAPVLKGIPATFMFFKFFSSLARSKYLSPFSFSLVFFLWFTLQALLFYDYRFSHQLTLMVFHWSLSDSKSPQVFRTLLSILAVLKNAVVWMVFTRPPTSKSSNPFSNPLVTVLKAPITIGIIATFMSHSFFNFLTRSRYLSFFSHSFSFILGSAGTAKSTISQILFFCCWLLLGLVFWLRLFLDIILY